ncbi:tetratricopeptide repeat protein [Clostridium estertheticum]|uniref:tetratricopeptide repeat protein n=1 Tax=Clostridium estertheticum TaxID=238834 RepID=UPI001CF45467|nr:tetratricopeptide repeat protein [Clostridium estertheticum]MCB2353140.1 tetratricopeptide repeat protein [Clostridium estertheticum]WAG41496.1 tetratricopeptide repeat protein [Clostridium estertheticum]
MEFEKYVVRVICSGYSPDLDENKNIDGINGTGFFIDKNRIVTAYHIISNYFDLGDNVYINAINLEDEKFYKARVITEKDQSQIAILELTKEFEITGLKFTENFIITPQVDEWLTFGHPKLKPKKGHIQKGLVSRRLNKLNSYNTDLDLEIYGPGIPDFSGMSGAPLIIKSMVVGVIIEQAEVGGKAISLAAVSINEFSKVIPNEYIEKLEDRKDEAFEKNSEKISNIPFNKNSCFTGRTDKLKDLYVALREYKVQVLIGISGVGKSQISVMYSYINSDEYNFIFWVRGDTDNNLFNDYKSIGKNVGILNGDNNNYEQCIKMVNKWLECNDKWLLIFDDCEDYDQIYSYIPNKHSGHIIITSKNPDWINLIKPLNIDPFTEDEAIKLLLKRSNKVVEFNEDDDIKSLLKKAGLEADNSAYELANKLGKLPLALNQAAAYIEENNISFKEYIELYNHYNLSLFEKNYDKKDYRYTVKTVWKISLEKIEKKLPLSIEIIKFLSVFSNNKIPNWIIKEKNDILKEVWGEKISILKYNEAISVLKRYALIESTGDFFHIHCLIQSVIQNEMNEKDEFHKYSDIATKFIFKMLPNDLGSHDEWKFVSDLIPHLRYIIEKIDIENPRYIDLLYRLGLCERFKLGVKQAEHTVEVALNLALEVYEDSDDKVLRIYNLLAGIKSEKGELSVAKEYYYKILNVLVSEGEESHHNIPIIKNNIGLILLHEGDYKNSKKLFQDALEFYKRDEGLYDKQIATTLSNLSIVNVNLEEYEEGKDNIDRALILIEKNLGVDNVVYSRALNNKGNILIALKDYKNAKEYFRKTIKLDEDFYPENHPEVLIKKNNLALCLINSSKGEIVQARDMLNKVIEISTNTEVRESKTFAEVLKTLALIYEKEQNYELAIKYLGDANSIHVKLNGELNLKVSENNKHIAKCLFKIDKQQSLNLYEDILKKDKVIAEGYEKGGIDLQNIQRIIEEELVELGILLVDEEIKRYKDSIKYIKEALKLRYERYGDDSVEVTVCIRTLSKSYFELDNYDNAYKYAYKALKNDLNNFDYNSEVVVLDYNNLAYILYMLGNKGKSKELIKKAMSILDKNISISASTIEIIKENYKKIMDSNKDSIIDTLKKYRFESIAYDDTLIIRPILKK